MTFDSGYYEGLKYRVTRDDGGMWYVQERIYGGPWIRTSRVDYKTRDEAVGKMFELVKKRDAPQKEPVQEEGCVYEEDIRETWEYIEK